jgi:hypothetical protein
MIINETTKTLFMEVPKTGSTTIRVAFQHAHGDANYPRMWTHAKIADLPKAFARASPNLVLEDFTRYAFYRDPISRMVSAWRYSISQWERSRAQTHEAPFSLYLRAAALFHLLWGTPFDEEAKPSLNDVTLDQMLDALESKVSFPTHDLFTPQSSYFDENTVLLSFANYAEEYPRIAQLLELPTELPEHLAKLNASDSEQYLEGVTPEQVQRIKAYYADDYAAFAARGITFD